jgi:prepilin-type N-terminal cleavage/methylation domain-containing protein
MNGDRGFSLIELLIVVAVIGIISAIAIPSLRNARQASQAASAAQSLRTLTTAQHLYHRQFNAYGTLVDLGAQATIDTTLQSGSKSGYNFAVNVLNRGAGVANGFEGFATPQDNPGRFRHLYVDETGVIKFETGAPATVASPPLE